MKIRMSLLFWFWRQTRPAIVIALPLACAYVLFKRDVLNWRDPGSLMFVLLHAAATCALLARSGSGEFVFLYSRGFSRDSLWAHRMLATFASILSVWLPASLLIWLGARSIVQDALFRSPYFPIMYRKELTIPFVWLLGYLVLTPAMHYHWIRKAQPTREASHLPMAALIATLFIVMDFPSTLMDFRGALITTAVVASAVALIGGLRLHRRLEVRG